MAIILPDSRAYSSRLFDYDRSRQVMSAEASTLQLRSFSRIYDDACDEGIAIENQRTGNVVRFYVAETHGVEGNISGWVLKPIDEDVRRHPGSAGLSVLIVND